ncbi:hypothetical protein [Ectopseudomonas composti]|uniref:hypothetical protein n=1 Tax=Ectopseudomonas composti TaxID=658457 RepID=UPI0012E37E1B|nr:hypothetical protein [Pseudomonas composti]
MPLVIRLPSSCVQQLRLPMTRSAMSAIRGAQRMGRASPSQFIREPSLCSGDETHHFKSFLALAAALDSPARAVC